jgi:hypothetical protein
MFSFLLTIASERVSLITVPNAFLSDAGLSILFEFIEDQYGLSVLKMYNNIMNLVYKGIEVPLLISGTSLLALSLRDKK